MANPQQNNEPVISRTEQKVLNQSQDKVFDVLAVEMLGVDDADSPTALNRVEVNDGAINIGGISIPAYDYASQSQTSTEDVWTFKTGGSSGTTVATLTITYTDSTKETISTVERT